MNIEKLKEKPFNLNEQDLKWVFDTFQQMSHEDKIRQLFCLELFDDDEALIKEMSQLYKPGGYLIRRTSKASYSSAVNHVWEYSKIPPLIAANLETGGIGAIEEGTFLGNPMEIAATDDITMAKHLGEICGKEGSEVGVNWSFAPVTDIDFNFRNPITNIRTFGNDPQRVCDMSVAYINEIQKHGIAGCFKHFPGDGRDERDQHIVTTINDCTCEEWDQTYGRIYQHCIEAGCKTAMVGHILMPAYEQHFNPNVDFGHMLPASISDNMVTKVLREKLKFNGVIITDATNMAGLTSVLPRKDLVPKTIQAGCDMFLFAKNPQEDIAFMEEGYKNGVITQERLDDAVLRILALKASLHLHQPQQKEKVSDEEKKQFHQWTKECAEEAITLVKEEKGVLPISPRRYPRILYYPLSDDTSQFPAFLRQKQNVNDVFVEMLKDEGFKVKIFDREHPSHNKIDSVEEAVANYDLILYGAKLTNRSGNMVVRIKWENPMNSNVPVFIHTIPTIFISFENPYHLLDVPQVRTYINCYSDSKEMVQELLNKLMGKKTFAGINPIDPFCGKWDTSLR